MCWIQELSNSYCQGKERPFFSPGTSVDAERKTERPELNGFIDVVLKQFKHSKDNENNTCSNLDDEGQSSNLNHPTDESQTQDLSEKRSLFGGLSSTTCIFILLCSLISSFLHLSLFNI